jgi:hypothetical protein
MKYLNLLAGFLVVFSVMLVGSDADAGFGISPAKLENDKLLGGMVWEQSIIVGRSPESANQALKIEVLIEGDQLKNMVSLESAQPLKLEAGMTQLPVKFKVTVPSGATLGKYSGSIVFNSTPESAAGGSAGPSVKPFMSAKAAVSLTVTDKLIENFRLEAFSIPKTEQGEPIAINYRINNIGNTTAKITRIHVDIVKYRSRAEVLYKTDIDELRESSPFSVKNFSEKINVSLEPKLYAAVLTFYNGDKVVKKTESGFEVAGIGSMLNGRLNIFKLDKSYVRVGAPVTATAQFKNTGEKYVTAKLIISILDDDGAVLQKIETKEVEVKAKDLAEFSVPFTPEKYGKVTVSGSVEFNGIVSDDGSAELTVGLSMAAVAGILVCALFGAALIAFLIRFFIKK